MSVFILRCPLCYTLGENVTDYSAEGYAYCNSCKGSFNVHEEERDLFHQLWTIAARLQGYEKRIWHRLQELAKY